MNDIKAKIINLGCRLNIYEGEIIKFYSKKKSLVADLKKFVQNGDIIYIKGSRGMKMEEIIDGLQT